MLIIPKKYTLKLLPETTEVAIQHIKDSFQKHLSKALNLRRVTAPLFVLSGTGINDDLNGVEHPVSFNIDAIGGQKAEVVHSLAKWKRMKLGAYDIAPGYGLYTDMNAIRTFEDLDNLHSLYVDQWDWEKTIREEDRNLDYLKDTVKKIYSALKKVEAEIYEKFPHITPWLPEEVTFIHSQELLDKYPGLTPKERENKAAKEFGAVFIIGIGAPLSNGEPHDGRAPDYDDWISSNEDGYKGLNGDLILWNPVLECGFELSSMGIRVSPESLKAQLKERGCEEREKFDFHKSLLNGELPYAIGGGIGQSRLCMYLLQKAHIGEVQASIWPADQIEACRAHNIHLL
ncbi:MAG: aspartate--ammonia ligase [Muribaculaceae bacterium]|nr:aspartate--ammonia ligase [Muribaculaceae bacterium]MDE6632307.1 aspartate--ammonia ligase [Muribaculaceae bacterium]